MDCLIVTYYFANNYGSFLQALALKNYFESKGFNVKFWASKKYEETDLSANTYKNKVIQKLSTARQHFELDYNLKHKYDLVVVGSDVVWASTKIKPFWGIGIKGKKFVSYAASLYGMCSNLKVNNKVVNFLIAVRLLKRFFSLKKFKILTVRDQKTLSSLKKLVWLKKIEQVLDPTFLLDYKECNCQSLIKEKYLLVYSYGLVGEDINCVFEYAKNHNCKICVVGHEAKYADYNLAPSPHELITLFKNAEAVISTTFHGTALAIENNKKFIVFESKKSYALLHDLNLDDRFVNSNNALKILEKDIDYNLINKTIKEKKNISLSALEKMI